MSDATTTPTPAHDDLSTKVEAIVDDKNRARTALTSLMNVGKDAVTKLKDIVGELVGADDTDGSGHADLGEIADRIGALITNLEGGATEAASTVPTEATLQPSAPASH